VEQLAYNARGQRKLIAYSNGTMTRYAYDPDTFRLARLRTEKHRDPANTDADTWEGTGAPLQDLAYSYDLVGNILSIDERTPDSGIPNTSNGRDQLVRTFEYDPLYRLTKATGREHDVSYPKPDPWTDRQGHTDPSSTRDYERQYRYDAASNLERLRHVANGGRFTQELTTKSGSNRLDTLTVGNGSTTQYDYTYDDSGNLTQENTARHLSWDHADRMRSFRVQTGSSPPSNTNCLMKSGLSVG
jgi:YD repeat-containing protein